MNYNNSTKIFNRLLWPSLGCLLIACEPVDRSAEQRASGQEKPAQIDSCDNAEPLRQALFGDLHAYGPDSVRFYTKRKTITQRWPSAGVREGVLFSMPS